MFRTFISFPKTKNKSELILSKMTEDMKTLNILDETPNKNDNDSFLTNLCKSSKKLIKNSRRYNSYVELPRFFKHSFPYRPNTSKSSKSSLDLNFTKYNEKKEKISIKKIIKRDSKFFLKLKKIRFVLSKSTVNEDIFFDFVDRSNINTKIKKEYDDYLESHKINKDTNFLVYKLIDIMKKSKFDKKFFFGKNNYCKINKFITKNNLLIKLKVSSLKIIFYKYNYNKNKEKKINMNNSSDLLKDISIISRIYFPFEFIPFFYGLNLKDFLKFLILVIKYDFSKKNFNLNFAQFIKSYNSFIEKKSFFDEKSLFKKYNEKVEEYFAFYWDVKNEKNNENYLMKIFLPKMCIRIGDKEKNFFLKFFYTLEIDKIVHLMKDGFKLWDFFVIKFFSDYKIFRFEINRILCNKYSCYNNNLSNGNNISFNKNKKMFNFNKINEKDYKLNNSTNNFQFFYTRKNQLNSEKNLIEDNTFLFEIEIPKIHINYLYQNKNLIDKYFDLNMKRLLQINKLKKSFVLEDIIKFSMNIVDKNEKKTKLIKKLSFYENNKFRRNKKAATISTNLKQIRKNIKTNSLRGNIKNISLNRKKSVSLPKKENIKQEIKKDIKLNLDKYIFNFDEDILKFINKPKEEIKNEINLNNNSQHMKKIKYIKLMRNYSTKVNNKKFLLNSFHNTSNEKKNKNLKIEFGKMKLIWTEKNLEDYQYIFKEKENQFLLDNPSFIWREYIQDRIDKIKKKIKSNGYM